MFHEIFVHFLVYRGNLFSSIGSHRIPSIGVPHIYGETFFCQCTVHWCILHMPDSDWITIKSVVCYIGLINNIDTKAKCRHLKILTCKKDFAAGVYLSETHSPLRVCLGWSSNFVGSESGQIQSVKLFQNMVSNRTPQPPPSSSHSLSVYTVLCHREGEETQDCPGFWLLEIKKNTNFNSLELN